MWKFSTKYVHRSNCSFSQDDLRRTSGLALLACTGVSFAQLTPGPGAKPATVMPDVIQVPTAAEPSEHFDADAVINAYLAQILDNARSRRLL